MPLTHELNRIVRHTVAPLVILAVERGWIPEAAQHDITEIATILVALGGVYLWSKWNARPTERTEYDRETH